MSSAIAAGQYGSSWAKELRVRPPRDIDVMFCLPWEVYFRFEERAGNRQSQLLQELRSVLLRTYSTSAMRGDGQAVVVQFARMPVEVVPAFALNNGQYLIADTKHEGSWRHSDPAAELAALNRSDAATGGATRRLVRMAKQWQRYCDVPIKSFMLERFAVAFLDGWQHPHSYHYHGWMVRDFFAFMLGYVGGTVIMPGTGHHSPHMSPGVTFERVYYELKRMLPRVSCRPARRSSPPSSASRSHRASPRCATRYIV